MRNLIKFLLALFIAFAAMLTFRALVFTIYTVPSQALEPTFKRGDRVMVNRWAYGLRTHSNGLFSYGRICKRPVSRGDWLAIDNDLGEVRLARCTALPGDTIRQGRRQLLVPGKKASCAHHDYYQVDGRELVREEQIIGRVVLVVYNHTPGYVMWHGNDMSRLLLPL